MASENLHNLPAGAPASSTKKAITRLRQSALQPIPQSSPAISRLFACGQSSFSGQQAQSEKVQCWMVNQLFPFALTLAKPILLKASFHRASALAALSSLVPSVRITWSARRAFSMAGIWLLIRSIAFDRVMP